ncbi:hypothetical protein [Mycolicibacterium sarraceniae]|nr:hypothetical protein [Mycolicibacterium sarraceniae]
MKRSNASAAATVTVGAMVVATVLSGCGVVRGIMNDGVTDPITPEQSKTQVIDAAKDIVGILNLPVQSATFWRSSCNDQGEAPFRGRMLISYPLAPSFEASDAEVARWVEQLKTQGWTTDPTAHTHGALLTKNGVSATFGPQSVSDTQRDLELLGECRDLTTTKQTAGGNEDISLR